MKYIMILDEIKFVMYESNKFDLKEILSKYFKNSPYHRIIAFESTNNDELITGRINADIVKLDSA